MRECVIYLDELPESSSPIPLEFHLEKDEIEEVKSVGALDVCDPVITYTLKNIRQIHILDITIECEYTVIDNHTLEPVKTSIHYPIELTIDENDPENSDLDADENGRYDVREFIVAVIVSMIPLDYSETELEGPIRTDDYTLMSEEEYHRQKRAEDNPFSLLDDDQFSDGDDR